jgi:arsenite methyltransferase
VALTEIHRVLRPGARLVILDTDWESIVWHLNDARMSRILAAWEQHAADVHLPRTMAAKLCRAGFGMQSQEVIPLFNPSYDPNTFSNWIIDLIIPFVAGRNGITRDEVEGRAKHLRQSGEQGTYFFSLIVTFSSRKRTHEQAFGHGASGCAAQLCVRPERPSATLPDALVASLLGAR